ncbi:unnamed protein product [Toxocara canis]|uniref:Ig-like domain-containing protein n=1 Tax=Toxocara canis TaxID=6265 RepID=A0A183U7Q6_TOXCA|nr:unnamed protein product [Toxocara canis]
MRQRSICKLVELNPWDISINKFLQPVSGPKWQCNLSADHYTELRNGRIRVIKGLDKNETCKYRCILPNGEENYNATSWKALERNISEPCECDLVETRCENSSSTLFAYVHMQV